MSFNARVYKILIASPGDVTKEREDVRSLVEDWNIINAAATHMILFPVLWETHSTPRLGDRPQAIVNRQIVDDCDAIIGIFWTRLGTATGVAESGTAEEVDRVVAAGKPALLYFSDKAASPSTLDQAQMKRLHDYRERWRARGLVKGFKTRTKFREHLIADVARLAHEWRGSQGRPEPNGGEHQGMIHQMVSDNQVGWDFPRFGPIRNTDK